MPRILTEDFFQGLEPDTVEEFVSHKLNSYPSAPLDPKKRRGWMQTRNWSIGDYRPTEAIIGGMKKEKRT